MELFAPWALARMPAGWTMPALCSSLRAQSAVHRAPVGGVAERLNAPVLKTGSPSRGSWVRIPPPPPIPSHRHLNIRAARVIGARGFFRSGVRK